jgi:hypothetical protein
MKLNVFFTIAAVYGFIIGLAALLAPSTIAAAGGLPASSGLFMVVRFFGVANMGLGLMAWLVRNADASQARDAVTLGFTIFFALHALTSLYGQFTDTSISLHWIMAVLQGLIAIGFFMAGRSSMSSSVS